MKNIIVVVTVGLLLTMGNLVMSSCGSATVKKSRIHGTMESAQWDGKKIYLVPMFGHVDAAHVDSTIIKNGRFEFATDSCEMKRITVEVSARYGTQDLLVVTEPGDIQVSIGKNSRAGGTPENDSLQVWKDQLMKYSAVLNLLSKQEKYVNDTSLLKSKRKAIISQITSYTEQMKKRMSSGPFKTFLEKMYTSK